LACRFWLDLKKIQEKKRWEIYSHDSDFHMKKSSGSMHWTLMCPNESWFVRYIRWTWEKCTPIMKRWSWRKTIKAHELKIRTSNRDWTWVCYIKMQLTVKSNQRVLGTIMFFKLVYWNYGVYLWWRRFVTLYAFITNVCWYGKFDHEAFIM
jgi:hypothetical protein